MCFSWNLFLMILQVPSFRAQIPNNESVRTENHLVPEANIHENIKPTHEPIDGVLMLDPDQDYSAEDSDLQQNDFRQILDSLQGSQLTSNFLGRFVNPCRFLGALSYPKCYKMTQSLELLRDKHFFIQVSD